MFEKEILERLQEMYRGGMTQEELSKATGISRPYLALMLAGKRALKNPTVDLLLKVFPRATVNLTGDVNTATADRGSTAIANAGTNNNFFTPPTAAAVADYRLKAMDAVLGLKLPPDATDAVLRALKDIK